MNTPKHLALIVAVIALACSLVVGVYALTIIPAPEHIINTPETSPTPAPTTSPTPSPSPIPTITLHLTSNNTTPFYKGYTLRMVAALTPIQAGITVTLYNNGASVTTAQTNSTGQAVFDRAPTNPFDYTVTATLP